ncbi:MAG: hypothetical protein ACRD3C_08500, partial [Vicinamibacterales bacterium]
MSARVGSRTIVVRRSLFTTRIGTPHAARTHASDDDPLRLRQRQRGVSDHLAGRRLGRPTS